MNLKQVILVRTDLKMSKGKLAAQVAHASVEAALKSKKYKEKLFKAWRTIGMKKTILKVKSKEDLFKFKQQAEDSSLITALIQDAGHTEIPAGTYTCLAIGPDQEDKIDKITGALLAL